MRQMVSELGCQGIREQTNKMSDTMKKFPFDLKCRAFVGGKRRLESSCAVSEEEEMLVAL